MQKLNVTLTGKVMLADGEWIPANRKVTGKFREEICGDWSELLDAAKRLVSQPVVSGPGRFAAERVTDVEFV